MPLPAVGCRWISRCGSWWGTQQRRDTTALFHPLQAILVVAVVHNRTYGMCASKDSAANRDVPDRLRCRSFNAFKDLAHPAMASDGKDDIHEVLQTGRISDSKCCPGRCVRGGTACQ